MAAAPEAPRDPLPSPATLGRAAWRGICVSVVREARFIAEACIGGRLHLRPRHAPLQLEPGGIAPRRGQCLRNRRPRAGACGRREGRPGPGSEGRGPAARPALGGGGPRPLLQPRTRCWPRDPGVRSGDPAAARVQPWARRLVPARAPLAAHLSGAPRRPPRGAGAPVSFPRAAANAAPAAAARAGPLPRCRGSPGPRPPLH